MTLAGSPAPRNRRSPAGSPPWAVDLRHFVRFVQGLLPDLMQMGVVPGIRSSYKGGWRPREVSRPMTGGNGLPAVIPAAPTMAPRSSTARRSPATIGGATSPSARTPSEWITLGSTAALGIWTLLIVFVPSVRFYLLWPGARTPLETLGILVAGMTGALAYLRYSLTGVRSSLLIALAFVVLAANQLVFGASVRALSGAPRELMLYLFTAGRIVAGGLFVARAARDFLPEREKPRKPLRVFVSSSAVSLGIVALTDGVLLAFRQHLPALSSGPAANPSGELTRVTAPDLILGSLTAALYIAGSFAYLRRLRGRGDLVWLPGALVVAA